MAVSDYVMVEQLPANSRNFTMGIHVQDGSDGTILVQEIFSLDHDPFYGVAATAVVLDELNGARSFAELSELIEHPFVKAITHNMDLSNLRLFPVWCDDARAKHGLPRRHS